LILLIDTGVHGIDFITTVIDNTDNPISTRGVQKVLQIDIQKIHKALEFDFI